MKLWNSDLGSSLVVNQSNTPMRHVNMICCLHSKYFQMTNSNQGDLNEFLFSAGYDGKINIWEIFEKKKFGHSSIMVRFSYDPSVGIQHRSAVEVFHYCSQGRRSRCNCF